MQMARIISEIVYDYQTTRLFAYT